jgi:hypothetical protein
MTEDFETAKLRLKKTYYLFDLLRVNTEESQALGYSGLRVTLRVLAVGIHKSG